MDVELSDSKSDNDSTTSDDTIYMDMLTINTSEQLGNATTTILLDPELPPFTSIHILMITIGVAGLLGNVLTIVVLSRPTMKSSINCFLVALAIFDSVLIFSAFFTYTAIGSVSPYTGLYAYPLGMIARTGSVWLTVAVTIERYVVVCLPLRARSLCTYGRARICIVVISAFSVMYNLSRFWELEVHYYKDPDSQEISEYVWFSWLLEKKLYIDVYGIWMNVFVIYVIPLIMLAVLNGIMLSRVRKANRERKLLSGQQQNEIKLTIMLFCVVAVFFLCNLLTMIVKILHLNGISIGEMNELSNLMVITNSSVNFAIFCIFVSKFRRILLRVMCSCCPSSLCFCRLLSRVDELDN